MRKIYTIETASTELFIAFIKKNKQYIKKLTKRNNNSRKAFSLLIKKSKSSDDKFMDIVLGIISVTLEKNYTDISGALK
jgi:hypothetical protein